MKSGTSKVEELLKNYGEDFGQINADENSITKGWSSMKEKFISLVSSSIRRSILLIETRVEMLIQ